MGRFFYWCPKRSKKIWTGVQWMWSWCHPWRQPKVIRSCLDGKQPHTHTHTQNVNNLNCLVLKLLIQYSTFLCIFYFYLFYFYFFIFPKTDWLIALGLGTHNASFVFRKKSLNFQSLFIGVYHRCNTSWRIFFCSVYLSSKTWTNLWKLCDQSSIFWPFVKMPYLSCFNVCKPLCNPLHCFSLSLL